MIPVAPLVGSLMAPPVLVIGILALLAAVLVGHVLLGVAWKLLVLALVAALALWALGTIQTVLLAV